MLSHTGEKPFICKQCNYLFVYLHIRHPGTSFLRSSYNYIFKNIAYVIVYVWPSRTLDEILLPFQKGLFFPLGDIRLFLPTRIRICAYAHHPTWIRIIRIRMAIPSTFAISAKIVSVCLCVRHHSNFSTVGPFWGCLDHTNHIFSESWWCPLSTDSLPTHPSPTQTHHTHENHPRPTYYDYFSTLWCCTLYEPYIFCPLTHHPNRPTIPTKVAAVSL